VKIDNFKTAQNSKKTFFQNYFMCYRTRFWLNQSFVNVFDIIAEFKPQKQ